MSDFPPDVLDQLGNNAAVQCPSCKRVFIVSAFLHKKTGRLCPDCKQSLATFGPDGPSIGLLSV